MRLYAYVYTHSTVYRYREKLEYLLSVLTKQHNRLVELMNTPHAPVSSKNTSNKPRAGTELISGSNANIQYEHVSPDSNDILMIYQTLKQQRDNLAKLTDTIRYNMLQLYTYGYI